VIVRKDYKTPGLNLMRAVAAVFDGRIRADPALRDELYLGLLRTLGVPLRLESIEPLRESCRLHALRGWSHVKHIEEVCARGS
jgi:hypothetical protein